MSKSRRRFDRGSRDPPTSSGTSSRSRAGRAPLAAELALDGGRVACTVENVSEGGLFIALASPPPVGARVLVTFELAAGRAIKADVEVRWLRAGEELGASVRFVALEPDDAAAIREYVAGRALLGGESALPGR